MPTTHPSRQSNEELATLREFLCIYSNISEVETKYRNYFSITVAIALILISISLIGGGASLISPKVAVVCALFGGMGCGVAYTFRLTLSQLPMLTKYTRLEEFEVRKRIEELESNMNA